MRELLAVARRYGVEVHASHLPGDKVGCYIPSLNRIYFDLSLTLAGRRSVIAHELGHVHFGHDCDTETHERQADTFAAQLLIDPAEYARLELIHADAGWIAEEMTVAPYVIEDFRRYCLSRIGGVTYASPRLGAGQWAWKSAASL